VIVIGEHVCWWVAEKTGHSYYSNSGQGIGIEKDGEIVCGVMFEGFNGQSIQIHVAMNPDAKMNREWIFVVFDYAFRQLKVNKIIGIVDSTNDKALRFDRHIGFVDEAVIKDAGKHGDLCILTMTRQQCRFLKD
jgi:RimJ/RimL family protein N-acetyltransferase